MKGFPARTIPDAPVSIVAGIGICYTAACAPADMPIEEVTDWVNRLAGPTGLDHRWVPSMDEAFNSGEANPCPCEQAEGRIHRLYEC